MTNFPTKLLSEDDYLFSQEKVDYRIEFIEGKELRMPVTGINHNSIKQNLSGIIGTILKKKRRSKLFFQPENSYSEKFFLWLSGCDNYLWIKSIR